jgi:hypothetical protein
MIVNNRIGSIYKAYFLRTFFVKVGFVFAQWIKMHTNHHIIC